MDLLTRTLLTGRVGSWEYRRINHISFTKVHIHIEYNLRKWKVAKLFPLQKYDRTCGIWFSSNHLT